MRIVLICLRTLILLLIAGAACGVLVVSGTVLYLSPQLPDIEELKEIQLHTPLRIFSQDNKLIAEFGEQRRKPLRYDQIPEKAIQAILAAEDDQFFQHNGVDITSLTRALVELIKSGSIRSGGSTITMQVAKNFFLSHERKFIRKFNEILLALQIEQALSKEQILELYLNKIFLGNRAYGIAAAAQVYFGQEVETLTTAQIAMIAGLPKAPSRYNPLVNAKRAKLRRDWILKRMLALDYIQQAEYQQATAEPITASFHGLPTEVDASYFAEMVRQEMFQQFGDDTYLKGYNVYTTIDSKLQTAAEQAVMDGLIAYSERHGYHGPEQHIKPEQMASITEDQSWTQHLKAPPVIGPLEAALVLETQALSAQVRRSNGEIAVLEMDALKWASPYKSANKTGQKPETIPEVLSPGHVIRIRQVTPTQDKKSKQTAIETNNEPYWQLSQIPKAQAALTSINTHDGAISSMVGGFAFELNKFNRAIQAQRQAGSCFKPFVYGAAIANGYTAASIINDAPIVYDDISQGEAWRPQNSGEQFKGPIRLRQALFESRNLVSIRLLQELGIGKVIDFAVATGLKKSRIKRNLSIALGTAQFTTTEMARAYSTIANGGYKVKPYFIKEITDSNGDIVFSASPLQACGTDCDVGIAQAPQVIDPRDHFILNSLLEDVIKKGTGRQAKSLKRSDIAGKTGTTNDQRDGWFSGYHPTIATSVWVGFDQPMTLGRREYGGKTALPIWIDFMKVALDGVPESELVVPEGISSIKIDPETGLRAFKNQENSIFEYFKTENAPEEWNESNQALPKSMKSESQTLENIF